MPLLRGCCSLDLQVGTKIIGVMCLIFSMLAFFGMLFLAALCYFLMDVVLEIVSKTMEEQLELQRNLTGGVTPDDDPKNTIDLIKNNWNFVLILMIVLVCLHLHDIICNSCLIHGIRKNTRGFLMPWIITHFIYLLLEVGIIVLLFVIIGYLPPLYKIVLPVIAIYVLWIALHLYLLLVVISQFQALGLIRMHDEMCMK